MPRRAFVGMKLQIPKSPNPFVPSLAQKGTFAPDTHSRWMGSIAMNPAGTIAVGYSVSSSTVNPSIRFTGRCSADAAGTMQNEVEAVSGLGSQQTNLGRWGDYATMVVDPSDDKTFWFTTQYLQTKGTFNWSTAIVPITITCP